MHKGLLQEVAPSLMLCNGFEDDNEHFYAFRDTAESTILHFLWWAYTRDYQVESCFVETAEQPNNELIVHARVYLFADTYHISELKGLAFNKLTSLVRILNENVQAPEPRGRGYPKKKGKTKESASAPVPEKFDAPMTNACAPTPPQTQAEINANRNNLVNLFAYCFLDTVYENGFERPIFGDGDELKTWLGQFAVCHIELGGLREISRKTA
ncbi:MAG: hypothetical protein Q9227_004216 [Pyrenula ochraceoflavens]